MEVSEGLSQIDNFVEPHQRDAAASLKMTTRRVFIFTLFVFCLSPVSVLSDGQYSMVLSDSIIHHRSMYLNAYRFPGTVSQDGRCGASTERESHSSDTYQLVRIGENVVYCYPNGGSILSLPFVALMSTVGLRPTYNNGIYNYVGEAKMQRLIASILMALLACIVFRTSLLLLDTPTSILVTFGVAFGTQIWSTASRTLWSHTWLVFLASWVAYFLLRSAHQKSKLHPIIVATLLSWMYFVRPTGAIAITCIAVYVFACGRREFLAFVAVGVFWFAGFLIYSWFTFGRLLPKYYVDFRSQWSQLPTALEGTLLSPSRGLFVFVPAAAFILYLLARYWHHIPCKRIVVVSLGIIAIHILLIASWVCWWGGYGYGPRLCTDFVPWLALLAIMGLAARSANAPSTPRNLEAAIGLFLLAISVVVNGRGAISWATFRWNNAVDIDFHPYRAFDWSYPQFMAGILPAPKYGQDR